MTKEAPAPVRIEVSPGELVDKITILEIKSGRIDDPAKLKNVTHELAALTRVAAVLPESDDLGRLRGALKKVNEALWEIEDEIRLCERNRDFGPRFVELARSVYRSNDQRAQLKRRINELLGSAIVEEKSYQDY